MDIMVVLGVIGLFMVRVGLPLVALIGLGLLIDRWQNKRNLELKRQQMPGRIVRLFEDGETESEESNDQRKAA